MFDKNHIVSMTNVLAIRMFANEEGVYLQFKYRNHLVIRHAQNWATLNKKWTTWVGHWLSGHVNLC